MYAWTCRPQCRADAGQQSTAPDSRDDGINIRQILEDLEADRSVPGDELVIVEWVDEASRHAVRPVGFDNLPAFVVGGPDDGGAEPFDRRDLCCGRRLHHHHRTRQAGDARRQGDALRRIPGAHRPDTFAGLGRIELPDDVVRPADLERSDRLQRFELQENLGAGQPRRELGRQIQADERGANDDVIDGAAGLFDGDERNVPHR